METRINSLKTLTSRLGYLVQPQLLIYIKGGVASANFEYEHITPETIFGAAHEVRSGWIFGGGIETVLHQNWSVFLEYNRIDFGKKTKDYDYSNGYSFTWTNDNALDILTFGLNYNL